MIKNYLHKFLVYFICYGTLFANSVKDTKNLIKEQIHQVEIALHYAEKSYILLQQELIDNKKLLDKANQKLLYNQDKLARMLQALRSLSNYSPYITALTNDSFQDLIHLYVLIKSMTPSFKNYHREISDMIIHIGNLHKMDKILNKKVRLFADKCYEYQELLNQLDNK